MLDNQAQNPLHMCVLKSASKMKKQIAFWQNGVTSEYAS